VISLRSGSPATVRRQIGRHSLSARSPALWRQKRHLIDIPGSKILTHGPSLNKLESDCLGFEQRLLGQALGCRTHKSKGKPKRRRWGSRRDGPCQYDVRHTAPSGSASQLRYGTRLACRHRCGVETERRRPLASQLFNQVGARNGQSTGVVVPFSSIEPDPTAPRGT